jgi:hypothetical protein
MRISDLIGTTPSPDWVRIIVQCGLEQNAGVEVIRYLAALNRAVRDDPPPFCLPMFGDMFRTAASESGWLAVWLVKAAEAAGATARHHWRLAAMSYDGDERVVLKRHAVEQSNLVLVLLDILRVTHPGGVDEALGAALRELSPDYTLDRPFSIESQSADHVGVATADLVDVNLSTIRAVALHLLLWPAVNAECRPQDRGGVRGAMMRIVDNDLAFVAETARRLEARVNRLSPAEVSALVSASVRRLIRATSEEPIDFSYHLRFGTYP